MAKTRKQRGRQSGCPLFVYVGIEIMLRLGCRVWQRNGFVCFELCDPDTAEWSLLSTRHLCVVFMALFLQVPWRHRVPEQLLSRHRQYRRRIRQVNRCFNVDGAIFVLIRYGHGHRSVHLAQDFFAEVEGDMLHGEEILSWCVLQSCRVTIKHCTRVRRVSSTLNRAR